MWILFGLLAIVATFMNLYMYQTGKDYKVTMAFALSFTALTLCAKYSLIATWVDKEDWAALLDVVPTKEKALWIFTVVFILLNIAPIFLEHKRSHL